jgi:mRNA interferase RelE/StbE
VELIVSPIAVKYLLRLNADTRERIKNALHGLSHEPPQGDIKRMRDSDVYRLRIGQYRAIFERTDKIIVRKIGSRGDIYK